MRLSILRNRKKEIEMELACLESAIKLLELARDFAGERMHRNLSFREAIKLEECAFRKFAIAHIVHKCYGYVSQVFIMAFIVIAIMKRSTLSRNQNSRISQKISHKTNTFAKHRKKRLLKRGFYVRNTM